MIELNQQEIFRLPNLKGQIRVFPGGKVQQILIGDDQGILHLLSNNGELLKEDSKEQIATQKEIASMDLISSPTTQEKDRIIITSGSWILGLTKKLKDYLKFDTQSAETILFAYIEGNQLFAASQFMLYEYSYQNDKINQLYFFLCPDKINCMQIHYLSSKAHAILGCQDSCVRVLNQDQILYIIAMTAPVICMHIYSPNYKDIISQNRFEQRRCFVFGIEDGTILTADMGIDKASILNTFKVNNIVCLKPCDYFKNGQTSLIVATQNGLIQIYSENELKASKQFNEGIISIECGQFINQNGPVEILVATFSGKILLLKETQIISQKSLGKTSKEIENKIKQLKIEVEELQTQLNKRQPLAKKFKLSYKFLRNEENGNQKLIIDCQYPLELISIIGEKYSKCFDIKELKVSNYEIQLTQSGNYIVNVIPLNMNASQSFNFQIKSLANFQSINVMSIKHLANSTLTLKGTFSKQDMNMWVNALIDIPNMQEDTVLYLLRNSFTDTFLQIKYKQGQALFKSESVAAIYACRQFVMSQANQRGIQVEVKWECNDKGVTNYLEKLKSMQNEYSKILINYEILPAIKELLIDNQPNILSKEFQTLYNNEQEIIANYKQLPSKLKHIEELVLDTYTARCNLKSQFDQNIEHVRSLWNRDFNELLSYILK